MFRRKEKKINVESNGNCYILFFLILPAVLFIMALLLDTPIHIIQGLYNIIVSQDILLADYLKIGGIGATLTNVSLLLFFNILLIHKLKVKSSGVLIASLFTLMGFSFFGKNIFNVWPMYLGGYIYAKRQKIEFKNILVIIIFSTALAPAISMLALDMPFPIYISIPISILFGILCGYIITPLASNMNRLHDGYNLYNVGFTVGIIGLILNSLFKGFGIDIVQQQILSTEYDLIFKTFLVVLFATLIVVGFVLNGNSLKGYKRLLSFSGKLITDFTQLSGFGLTLINMGIMGFISMLFVLAMNHTIALNGPIIGGILTVVGFSAFGKHPRNTIPIMIGVFFAGSLKKWGVDSTQVIIAGLFGTTLAPIAGRYGIIAGIIAGFLHLSVSMTVGVTHGGLNLYNNGFAGGIVASFLFPLFNALKKGE